MKRESSEIEHLVQYYEQKQSETSVSLWMEVDDLLDILDYYEQKQLYFESEQCMRLALRLHPYNHEIIIRKAYRLKDEGRWQEAARIVRNISEQEFIDVYFFWAEYYLSQTMFEKAEEYFLKGIKIEKNKSIENSLEMSAILLEIGELFLNYGNISRAKKYLQQVSNSSTEYYRAQMGLSECSFRLGDVQTAIKQINRILDNAPYYVDAWIMLADLANENRDFHKCSEAADFALAIDPTNEKALRFKAVAALGLGQYNEVLNVYEEYRKYYPTDYTMALSAGEILMNQQQMKFVREILTNANQNCPNENPDKLRILNDIAITYAAQGEFQRMHEVLAGSCTLGINYTDVLLQTTQTALTYSAFDVANQALHYFFQLTSLTSEIRQKISQMLCNANCFEPLQDIWDKLLQVTELGVTTAAPYLAFAARRFHKIPEYIYRLTYACKEDPTQTKVVFQSIYPDSEPSEYIRQACMEFPK